MSISDQTIKAYLADLGAKRSTPGGGAVAAIVAAESAALVKMVAEFSKSERSDEIAADLDTTISSLNALADADTEAFQRVMQAYKTKEDLPAALNSAASVPAEVSRTCESLYPAIEYLEDQGNQNLVSDIGIAASLLDSVLTACEMNIRINLKSLEDPDQILVEAVANIPALQSKLRSISQRVMDKLS